MARTINDNTIVDRPTLVAEMCGPAGAGKTTLLRALRQCNQVFVEGDYLRVRRIGHIPFFLKDALLLLPAFLSHHRNSRWFTWDEIKMMVYLKGWPHVLLRQASNNGTVTLLDHGPVFRLTLNESVFSASKMLCFWSLLRKCGPYVLAPRSSIRIVRLASE